jgi:ribonuclease HII
MLELFCEDSNETQVGVDEVGRGCFSGPVVAGAVVWDSQWLQENVSKYPILSQIKDSKKLSEKKRKECETFIKNNSKAYAVSFVGPDVIDNENILKATMKAMHEAISKVDVLLKEGYQTGDQCVQIDRLLIDGNNFNPYVSITERSLQNMEDENYRLFIPHECVIKGDDVYLSIASASIIAKEARDAYMKKLCNDDPSLNEKYDWKNNKGYGTKKHMIGIEQHGLTEHHRKTFGMCKKFC